MEEPPKEQVRTRTVGNRTYLVADVEPLDVDGTRTVAVGTGLWLLAFILLLPFYGELQQSHRLWVLWTCLAGFGLGVLGWDYCRRRRKRRQALLAGPAEGPGENPGEDPGEDPA